MTIDIGQSLKDVLIGFEALVAMAILVFYAFLARSSRR